MPMQSQSGWNGVPWFACQRCGFPYPVSRLVRQSGLIVCIEKCYDKPIHTLSNDQRQATITQVLSSGVEEPELADILKETNNDVDDLG